jgi:hypothetical protein
LWLERKLDMLEQLMHVISHRKESVGFIYYGRRMIIAFDSLSPMGRNCGRNCSDCPKIQRKVGGIVHTPVVAIKQNDSIPFIGSLW